MTGTVFTIIGLIIGLCIAIAGGINLKKEWSDKDSQKVYGAFLGIGIAIVIGIIIKILVAGI